MKKKKDKLVTFVSVVTVILITVGVLFFLNKSPIEYITYDGNVGDVLIDGDYLYLSLGNSNKMAVVDISDPSNPGSPIYTTFTDYVRGIFIEDNYAYIACGQSGLAIVDISEPTDIGVPIYKNISSSVASDVVVSGDYAYLTLENDKTMAVIDVTDPLNPGTPITIGSDSEYVDICIKDDLAYLASYSSNVSIYNISNPLSPVKVGYLNDTESHGLTIEGSTLYVASFLHGFLIYDISDPLNIGNPTQISSEARDEVVINEDYAYVCCNNNGLEIYDISTPSNINLVKKMNVDGFVRSIAFNNEYAFIACAHKDLGIVKIVDIFD